MMPLIIFHIVRNQIIMLPGVAEHVRQIILSVGTYELILALDSNVSRRKMTNCDNQLKKNKNEHWPQNTAKHASTQQSCT